MCVVDGVCYGDTASSQDQALSAICHNYRSVPSCYECAVFMSCAPAGGLGSACMPNGSSRAMGAPFQKRHLICFSQKPHAHTFEEARLFGRSTEIHCVKVGTAKKFCEPCAPSHIAWFPRCPHAHEFLLPLFALSDCRSCVCFRT